MHIDPNNPHAGGEFHGFSDERKQQIQEKAGAKEFYNPPNSPSNPANINKPGFIPQSAAENERRARKARTMQMTDDGVTPSTPVVPASKQAQLNHMTPDQRALAASMQTAQPVTIPPVITQPVASRAVRREQAAQPAPVPVQAPQVQEPQTQAQEFVAGESRPGHVTQEEARNIAQGVEDAMKKHAFPAQPIRPDVQHVKDDVNQVPVEMPPYVAITEDRYVSLALPSRFHYYDFKDVYARPFQKKHLSKLAKAKLEQDTMPVIEAVSSVLKNSRGDTDIAFKLTIPDYYFILHWLRHESFTKFAFTHHDLCTNKRHIEMVDTGEKGVETLRVSEIINKTRLKVFTLDRAPDPADFKLDSQFITLRPALVSDVLELSNSPRMADSEFAYMAEAASYCTIYTEDENGTRPMTISEKVDFLQDDESDVSPDDIHVIFAWSKALDWYGVQETVRMRCKECGASWDSKVSLEAHSFLPAA